MIRVTKYIYINILTFAMLIFAWFNGQLPRICIAYTVMTIHELAHMLTARIIGLKAGRISFHPFGVNLKLKNRIICSVADEIVLYLSGPLVNAVFALAAVFIYQLYQNGFIRYFYICNILLFIINLLPVLPLDGGIILRKILSSALGYRTALIIMRIVSGIFTALMIAAGIYIFMKNGKNYSVLLLSALLLGNVFTQREKYNVDLVRELLFYKKKNKSNVKAIAVEENESGNLKKIIKKFSDNKYHIVYILSENGSIKRILTEDEIVDRIVF